MMTRQYKFIITFAKKNPNKPGDFTISYRNNVLKKYNTKTHGTSVIAPFISGFIFEHEKDQCGDKDSYIPQSLVPSSTHYKAIHMVQALEASINRGLEYISSQLTSKGRIFGGAIEVDCWWLPGSCNKIEVEMECIIDDDPDKGVIVEKQLKVNV